MGGLIYMLWVFCYFSWSPVIPFSKAVRLKFYMPTSTKHPPIPSSRTNISASLETIILRALAKNPDERFQTGAEMAAALAQVEDNEADNRTETQLEIPVRPRWPLRWLIMVIGVILVLGLGWWSGFGSARPELPETGTTLAAETTGQTLSFASATPSRFKGTNTATNTASLPLIATLAPADNHAYRDDIPSVGVALSGGDLA